MALIYRVNMTDLSVRTEEPSAEYRKLGGRALTSAMVEAEVPADCHPLSVENKLVITPGMLTGTGAPCSGRISAGAKSPLTGGIKESNAGGMGGIALATLGVHAIVLEGKPQPGKWYRLLVNKDGLRIEPADALSGLGNYDTVARLHAEFGDKVSIISIGQAGQMLAAGASIAVTDVEGRPTRHCGRGGLGAVMGSKGIKRGRRGTVQTRGAAVQCCAAQASAD
jgi:aldehyde:ferredoxin oxidoreductase